MKKSAKKKRGDSPVKTAGQWLAYAAFRTVERVLSWLPVTWVFTLGQGAGFLGWLLAPGYRDLVLRNLEIAFGREKSQAELRRLARAHFVTLGANLFTSLKLPTMDPAAVEKCVEFEGLEHVMAGWEAGKGWIYAICHMGNWELLTQAPQVCPKGVPSALYQPLGNRFLNDHVLRLRTRLGYRLYSRHDGFHAPVAHLRGNGGLGVLVDQHAGDGGLWVPLFGRLASSTNLAALLALRTGAPILPLGLFTTGRARWKIVIGQPVDVAGGDVAQVTAETMRRLEAFIAASPADWFWVHNRWKTPKPNFLLAHYKRGVVLPPTMSAGQLQPFQILVRAPNWLGDACMALPAVRAIKKGRPDARVTVLTPAKLADFWRAVGEVDAVIEKDSDGKKDGIFAVRRKIKASGVRFDVAVLLTGSPRSAFEIAGCGIGRVVGYRGRFRKWIVNQIVPEREPGPIEHHVHHFLRIAENMGANVDDHTLFEPIFADGGPRVRIDKPKIGLCAGAEYGPAKRWPVERFVEAANAVSDRLPCEWVLIGTKGDAPLGDELAAKLTGTVRNLIGKTTLAHLMQELTRCQLLLTNDTGTMHLAAALGVRTVAVFGSTEPEWTGPLGDGHVVIRRHVECSPCFLRECPLDFRCMKEIPPEVVAEAVVRQLQPVGSR